IYRGHGSKTTLGAPFNLSGSDIDNSTNSVYPYGFGFACSSNNFGYSYPCFGERWIRSAHGGISYFGATTTTLRHTNNVIEECVFEKMNDRDQLSPFINLGMKAYYKRFWSWLSGKRRKRHIKSYNLLGDPSIYLYGIGSQNNYIFTNNETFQSGDRIEYQATNDIVAAEGVATFTLQSGSNVNLIAGNSITLKDGFSSELGSEFNAIVNSYNNSSLKSSLIGSKNEQETDYKVKESILNIDDEFSVIACFPNPAKDNISFYFNINSTELNAISIIDINGKTLFMRDINDATGNKWQIMKIDISQLRPGVYFYL